MINCHHNNLLTGQFGIDKTRELVSQKYYWPSLRKDVKIYIREVDVCLTSKAVCYKLYENLQSLPVLTHQYKNISIDFVTGLPLSADWKGDSYDSIIVIIDWLTKMMHYKPFIVTIDALELTKIIIDVVVRYYDLPDSIISDWEAIFTSKFYSSLYYFLSIKQNSSTTFHSQTDGQTKRQNSMIEAYLLTFVNWEQNNWVWLLLMAEFAYSNSKNASTGHMPFKLNCGYYQRMLYKEKVDLRSQSKLADKLLVELRQLMIIC